MKTFLAYVCYYLSKLVEILMYIDLRTLLDPVYNKLLKWSQKLDKSNRVWENENNDDYLDRMG